MGRVVSLLILVRDALIAAALGWIGVTYAAPKPDAPSAKPPCASVQGADSAPCGRAGWSTEGGCPTEAR